MSVVEHKLLGILSETRYLLRARLIEALLVEPDIQASGEKGRVDLQLLGIESIRFSHRVQIFLQTLAIETGLLQILCGAHECPRFAANGRAQCAERTSSFGREKDQCFLSL